MRPFSAGGKKSTQYSHICRKDKAFSKLSKNGLVFISKIKFMGVFSIINNEHLSTIGKKSKIHSAVGTRKRR